MGAGRERRSIVASAEGLVRLEFRRDKPASHFSLSVPDTLGFRWDNYGDTMRTDRRSFFKLAGAAGAGLMTVGAVSANDKAAPLTDSQKDAPEAAFVTELFLDNDLLEVTPGVSRRLHKPRKHLLNPVVRCDRWCDGNNIQPYTTMYDKEDKLFKMWARAGSDWESAWLDGNAAYMLYFTSTDGVHWNKPDLGLMSIAGRRDHNIIFTSDMVLATDAARSQETKSFVVPSQPMTAPGQEGILLGGEQASQPQKREREVRRLGDCSRSSARSTHCHVARRHPLVVRERPLLADAE